jgi:hypothetical protein
VAYGLAPLQNMALLGCRQPSYDLLMSILAPEKPVLPAAPADLLRPRMPELDTIRGIAVLLVLFFHGFGFRYGVHGLSGLAKVFVAATLPGWIGVNLFFVLSGFLITGILIDTKSKADFYRSFYIRRALRILPLYYAVLLILAILTRTGWVDRQASWAFLGLSFVYLSNVTGLFGVAMHYGVLWSLARRRALLSAMAYLRSFAIALACGNNGGDHLYPLPLLAGFVLHSRIRYRHRIHLAGSGRTGNRGRIGRFSSWCMGNSCWYGAHHRHLFCDEPDNVWSWLSIRNISRQQIHGSYSKGNGAKSFFCRNDHIGACGRDLQLEGGGESAGTAVFRRNQLRRLPYSYAGL